MFSYRIDANGFYAECLISWTAELFQLLDSRIDDALSSMCGWQLDGLMNGQTDPRISYSLWGCGDRLLINKPCRATRCALSIFIRVFLLKCYRRTDRRIDRRTNTPSYRDVRMHLKTDIVMRTLCRKRFEGNEVFPWPGLPFWSNE